VLGSPTGTAAVWTGMPFSVQRRRDDGGLGEIEIVAAGRTGYLAGWDLLDLEDLDDVDRCGWPRRGTSCTEVETPSPFGAGVDVNLDGLGPRGRGAE